MWTSSIINPQKRTGKWSKRGRRVGEKVGQRIAGQVGKIAGGAVGEAISHILDKPPVGVHH